MPIWAWCLVGAAITLLLYGLFLLALLVAGRRADARAWAGFIPDCVVLFSRLVRDPRVPLPSKVLLGALIGYLALPFDLVPDFIPVIGVLDDAIVVALVLRVVLRASGPELVRAHWPGPEASLGTVLRLAGAPAAV
jgi:uncharacterized membrane protein YkvA (DUF1232 family)